MSPFVRKVRTASGATAVQIVAKEHGVRRIVEHLGSAHDEAELAVLVRAGRDRITALSGQAALDLESLGAGACVAGAVVDSKRCALLWDTFALSRYPDEYAATGLLGPTTTAPVVPDNALPVYQQAIDEAAKVTGTALMPWDTQLDPTTNTKDLEMKLQRMK